MSASPSPLELPVVLLTEDRGGSATIGMVVCTAIATATVFTRLYTRGIRTKQLGWDDWIITLAMVVSWVFMGLLFKIMKNGVGKHLATLVENPATMVSIYKWLIAAQLVYLFNLWLCRMSGIAFYARLNQPPHLKFYLRMSSAFVTTMYVTQTLIMALQCVPLAALWGEVQGKCLGSNMVVVTTAVMTIICDVLILLLPMRLILSVRLNMVRKIALGVVIFFGIIGVVTAICRMVAMLNAIHHPQDITWYLSIVLVWSCAEVASAIFALSLPSLNGLLGKHQIAPNIDSDRVKTNSSSGRRRIFQGPDTIPNKTHIDASRSLSQEQMWPAKGDNIQVVDTVRVDFGGKDESQKDRS